MYQDLKKYLNKFPVIRVSTIIVKYRAEKEFRKCLSSIPKKETEVLVVDNNKINRGYAKGNNQGAKQSTKEYLFILNPDTVLFPDTLSNLINFLDDHPIAAVVSILLLDSKTQPYPLQGTASLNPLTAIFSLSFIYKYWPNNPIANHYWLKSWNKGIPMQVSVVPGTAFLIRRSVFDRVGGFDENFFLYFEESDICRRIKKLGYEIWINPKSRLIHQWGRSSRGLGNDEVFKISRRYYFRKNFGRLASWLVEMLCDPRRVLK